ncbi:hypothetical protein [Legionella tunisiensis]|uniref:hypothetical protein n=1 Tax=Legionella tunisiensis TaxID=1034944 RepID=UPI00030CE83B|nr:hypothetical protein [Legionella tunisiensis]
MKRNYQCVLAGLILFPVLLFAANTGTELKPSLILKHIKVIKTGEPAGDELYFDISTYRAGKPVHYARIPELPNHWISQIMDKIRGVNLWSETLAAGEAVTVILSLNEADAAPWNNDDLIGSVKIQLKNEGGALQTRWSIPNRSDSLITTSGPAGDIHSFELMSENGNYEISIRLQSQAK